MNEKLQDVTIILNMLCDSICNINLLLNTWYIKKGG